MNLPLTDIITWLIVGAVAGYLAGLVVKRKKKGFGHLTNLGIGLVGALIGGLLFKLLAWMGVPLGFLSEVKVSLQEVVAGFVGALIFLGALWCVRWYRSGNGRSHED